MEVAALVLSILAFAASGWAAWATHRGARASESAVETARDALALARVADERDATRQRVESAPRFSVENSKGGPGRSGFKSVLVTCDGVLAYDNVSVALDLDDAKTAELATGFERDERSVHICDLGPMKIGDAREVAIIRRNRESSGQIKLLLTAHHGEVAWTSVHYVGVSPPPRIIFA